MPKTLDSSTEKFTANSTYVTQSSFVEFIYFLVLTIFNKLKLQICKYGINNFDTDIQSVPKKWNFRDFFYEYFSKNDPYRGNLMLGIECVYSRSVKTLP